MRGTRGVSGLWGVGLKAKVHYLIAWDRGGFKSFALGFGVKML
jgi:hypothetical protein